MLKSSSSIKLYFCCMVVNLKKKHKWNCGLTCKFCEDKYSQHFPPQHRYGAVLLWHVPPQICSEKGKHSLLVQGLSRVGEQKRLTSAGSCSELQVKLRSHGSGRRYPVLAAPGVIPGCGMEPDPSPRSKAVPGGHGHCLC